MGNDMAAIKMKKGAESICGKCMHVQVCRFLPPFPCIECYQFFPAVVRCKDCKKRDTKKCPLVMVRLDVKTNGTIKEVLEQNYVDKDFCCTTEHRGKLSQRYISLLTFGASLDGNCQPKIRLCQRLSRWGQSRCQKSRWRKCRKVSDNLTPYTICRKFRYYGQLCGNDRQIFCDHLNKTGKRREYDGENCLSFAPMYRSKAKRGGK